MPCVGSTPPPFLASDFDRYVSIAYGKKTEPGQHPNQSQQKFRICSKEIHFWMRAFSD